MTMHIIHQKPSEHAASEPADCVRFRQSGRSVSVDWLAPRRPVPGSAGRWPGGDLAQQLDMDGGDLVRREVDHLSPGFVPAPAGRGGARWGTARRAAAGLAETGAQTMSRRAAE